MASYIWWCDEPHHTVGKGRHAKSQRVCMTASDDDDRCIGPGPDGRRFCGARCLLIGTSENGVATLNDVGRLVMDSVKRQAMGQYHEERLPICKDCGSTAMFRSVQAERAPRKVGRVLGASVPYSPTTGQTRRAGAIRICRCQREAERRDAREDAERRSKPSEPVVPPLVAGPPAAKPVAPIGEYGEPIKPRREIPPGHRELETFACEACSCNIFRVTPKQMRCHDCNKIYRKGETIKVG